MSIEMVRDPDIEHTKQEMISEIKDMGEGFEHPTRGRGSVDVLRKYLPVSYESRRAWADMRRALQILENKRIIFGGVSLGKADKKLLLAALIIEDAQKPYPITRETYLLTFAGEFVGLLDSEVSTAKLIIRLPASIGARVTKQVEAERLDRQRLYRDRVAMNMAVRQSFAAVPRLSGVASRH